MSILIKGMKKPKNCHECVFGKYEVCAINISIEKKDTITRSCPLVEIPPHGRLIDADFFEKCIKMWIDHPNDYIRHRNQDMLYYVQGEATVIEAEESE